MLASTERSLEIERQRRNQLQHVDRFNGRSVARRPVDVSAEFSSPRSSEQFTNLKGPKTTTAALTRNVGQSVVADLTNVRKRIINDRLNNTSGVTSSSENRKLKNGNKPTRGTIVKRYNSTIRDVATSSGTSFATKFGVDEITEVRSAAFSTGTFQRRTNDSRLKSGRESHPADGLSGFPMRRWSSLKELSDGATLDHRSGRRGVSGRRTSRLDRQVYQCYFAGILHSSRRSERFVRLQQLYSLLENVVDMESEVLSLRQLITPSVTDHRGGTSLHSSPAIDPSLQKHLRQRSLELKKLYAKLDAAQYDKEFFYDNGRLDAFQWKSWKDLGLSRKTASLTKLKDWFEAAVFDSHSAISTSTSQLQPVERGLSYRKLLGMFRQLEKRTRKETESWLRWQALSQQSISSSRSLDGTYIKIMESAARNAKTLALHGYHMDEHRNRYDAYVQSRRIYRPKSSHSILELQNSDDPLETDEAASSDLTTSVSSLCGNIPYCDENSDAVIAKSASDLTDCSQISSSLTSIGSATHCTTSRQPADTCTEAKAAVCAKDVRESSPKVVRCKKTLTELQVIENKGVGVDELDTSAAKLDSRSKQKSRKRERQRPRCRHQNGTTAQRSDTHSAVPGNAGRRHIEAWRRSSRPLSGTLNQALTYFNSLCIDNSNEKNDCPTQHNCHSVVSPNDKRETQNETNDATAFDQMTPASGTSTQNVEVPIAQFSECKNKFLSEVKQNVNSAESVGVHDRRKVVLPQLYSCRDDVRGADSPSSNVASFPSPTCSKGLNIDKHRSQTTADAIEPNSQSRMYADGEMKKTKAEIADTRSVTSQDDVTLVPEVRPTYVRSAPVVRMLSESQPIKTISVSSPKFVDCRQAIVRKLPTSINQSCQKSADCQFAFSDCTMSPASNSAVYMDAISTGKFAVADSLCPDDKPKQTVETNHRSKTDAGSVASMAAEAAAQRSRLPYVRTNVTYVTAIDSASFICKRCCRSLAVCSCESAAAIGSRYANDDVDCGYFHRANDSDNFTQTGRDRRQPSVMRSLDPWVIDNKRGPGSQDVEMRRMMDSLTMIDSEWTSGKPTRLMHPVHLLSDMKNNSQSRQQSSGSVNDERCLTLVHPNQHAGQVSMTSNGNYGDQLSQRVLNGDSSFVNKHESFDNGDNAVFDDRIDHDTNTSTNASHALPVEGSADSQSDSVQRLCALYDYRPRHADELQLNKGDIIYLVEVCDDGWLLGTSQRTKQFGTFPGNYVRQLT